MEEILKLDNISKKIGSEEILKGITLTLKKGDFVGLFGPSGSGKTTLLHIAGGLEKPTSGEVYLYGNRIDHLPEGEKDRYRRGKVAFIFQHHYLLENFTVEENLTIFGKLLGQKNVDKQVEEILNFLNLQHRRNHRTTALSGGERQRVAIGRALISGAKLILADEPTGSLDEKKAHEIFQYFQILNEEKGITFLVVTHNTYLKNYFNRSYYMLNGLISDKFPV